jgi:hypothetical protein
VESGGRRLTIIGAFGTRLVSNTAQRRQRAKAPASVMASVGGRRPQIMAHPVRNPCGHARRRSSTWCGTRFGARATKGISILGVLTGGDAILGRHAGKCGQIFNLPIRRGCPAGVGGVADHVNTPTGVTGVGLALYGYRNSPRRRSAPARSCAPPDGCAGSSESPSQTGWAGLKICATRVGRGRFEWLLECSGVHNWTDTADEGP